MSEHIIKISSVTKWFIDCLFPPFCRSCESYGNLANHSLCKDCMLELVPLDPSERCQHCFSLIEEDTLCPKCRIDVKVAVIQAYVFEYKEPAFSLLHEGAISGIAGYFIYQFCKMNWPLPNFVTYPEKEGNLLRLVAKEVAKMLEVPIKKNLSSDNGLWISFFPLQLPLLKRLASGYSLRWVGESTFHI